MNVDFYAIREIRNVLFANRVSPRLAALQFGRSGGISLSSVEDLHALAARRRKLLHVTGLPLDRRRVQTAEPIPA